MDLVAELTNLLLHLAVVAVGHALGLLKALSHERGLLGRDFPLGLNREGVLALAEGLGQAGGALLILVLPLVEMLEQSLQVVSLFARLRFVEGGSGRSERLGAEFDCLAVGLWRGEARALFLLLIIGVF